MERELAVALQLMEEEEDEYEQLMLAIARVAAMEMVELEEGMVLNENVWVYVTVNIDEYHMFGDPCFQMHFRMSRGVFEALVMAVGNHLRDRGRLRRERTPLQDILLMVVWLVATPDSFRSVALRFGVRPSTLHYFYAYVVEALREMSPQYITWPSAEERNAIKGTFQRASGFPGIVGCIDCTHVYVTAPLQHAAQYRNRHHSYSLNVQAVVDATMLVRDLHVGEVGSMGDARVFRRSPLSENLLQGRQLLPDEHLVGDGAYIVTDYMMAPYDNNGHLTPNQLNFNRRLSQCRVRVENAFGRAKSKWRRLKSLYARNQAYVVDYITACFTLHNFTILNGDQLWEDNELDRPIDAHEDIGLRDFPQDDDPEDEHPLLVEAQARGTEKRLFITDHVLPAFIQD